MSTPLRSEAQQRADDIACFREELAALAVGQRIEPWMEAFRVGL